MYSGAPLMLLLLAERALVAELLLLLSLLFEDDEKYVGVLIDLGFVMFGFFVLLLFEDEARN